MKYKSKQTITALIPFRRTPSTIHIEHVLNTDYEDKLIVYKVFGTNEKWRHYFMCFDDEMDGYVEKAKNNQ